MCAIRCVQLIAGKKRPHNLPEHRSVDIDRDVLNEDTTASNWVQRRTVMWVGCSFRRKAEMPAVSMHHPSGILALCVRERWLTDWLIDRITSMLRRREFHRNSCARKEVCLVTSFDGNFNRKHRSIERILCIDLSQAACNYSNMLGRLFAFRLLAFLPVASCFGLAGQRAGFRLSLLLPFLFLLLVCVCCLLGSFTRNQAGLSRLFEAHAQSISCFGHACAETH